MLLSAAFGAGAGGGRPGGSPPPCRGKAQGGDASVGAIGSSNPRRRGGGGGGGRRRLLLRITNAAAAAALLLVLLPASRAEEAACGSDSGTCPAAAREGGWEGAAVAGGGGGGGDDEYGEDIDVPDPCINSNPDCAKWAAEGECKNNPGFMLTSCPRACGTCPPLDEAKREREEAEAGVDCEDLHELCGKWAGEGECVLNPQYMEKACRDSCMLCINIKASRERGDSEDSVRRKRLFMTLDLGKRQEIPGDLDEDGQYRLKSLLRTVDGYSKDYLLDASTPPAARDRCRNEFELCGHWATEGMCASRVVYMLANCPLACRVCDRTEAFHRCTGKRHPLESPAFKAGWINEMFREIRGGKWDEYGPELVTGPGVGEGEGAEEDPYVVRFDRFLTEAETARLIEIGDDIGWMRSAVDGAEFDFRGREMPRRSSLSALCGPDMPCEGDPVLGAVLERVSKITGAPPRNFEAVELVRYGPGDSYGVHHDFRLHDEWKPAGPRVLTFLLILSDVEEGGATGFPDLDWLFVKPKRGQALLWSNVLSDDPTKMDKKLLHEGLPVVKGHKYVANVWIHLYDWRTALERDCV